MTTRIVGPNEKYLHSSAQMGLMDMVQPIHLYMSRAIVHCYKQYKDEDFAEFEKMTREECEQKFADDVILAFDDIQVKASEFELYIQQKEYMIRNWKKN
jgi:hypothetical protein